MPELVPVQNDNSETAPNWPPARASSPAAAWTSLHRDGAELSRSCTAVRWSRGSMAVSGKATPKSKRIKGASTVRRVEKFVRSRRIARSRISSCPRRAIVRAFAGAIALKNVIENSKLTGTLKLFGTPTEETVVGKVYMARAGVFDELDAVIDWHPSDETKVKNQPGRAMNNFEVEFFGQAAHGSADPWNGRSALDAVELMNYGVNLMREHVKPTTRIHYVIPSGGDAPNVVPEYAKVWYYVRDINREEVQKYYDRILKIAEGAALATETTHKVHLITGVHHYQHNRPMQEAIQKNLEMVGAPEFSNAEQEFARTLQRHVDKEEKGFSAEILPLPDGLGEIEGGSTDVAEVSWIVPTAGFRITTAAYDVPVARGARVLSGGDGRRVLRIAVGSTIRSGRQIAVPGRTRRRQQQFDSPIPAHLRTRELAAAAGAPKSSSPFQRSSASPRARSSFSPSPRHELPCMQASVVGFVRARRPINARAFFVWEK
jgi:amidohydrolase